MYGLFHIGRSWGHVSITHFLSSCTVCPPGATRIFALLIIQREKIVMLRSHLWLARIWVINGKSINRKVIAAFHPKRHLGLECRSLTRARRCWGLATSRSCPAGLRGVTCTSTLCSTGTRAALRRVEQKARRQKGLGSPLQLTQRLKMWPSVTWSSESRPKLNLKLGTHWEPDAPSEPNLSG